MSRGSHRELYTATVTSIDDPEQRGRIKIESRDFLGDGVEFPEWVEPCFPYVGANDAGWFFLPDVGETVMMSLITSHDDDPSEGMSLLMSGGQPMWHCVIYKTSDDFPSEFKDDYPNRMGIKTPAGQLFMFDESAVECVVKARTIKLGGEDSPEPLVLGTVFQTMMNTVLSAIASHVHGTSVGPTTAPTNAATFTGQASSPVGDGAVLRDVSFTQKASDL